LQHSLTRLKLDEAPTGQRRSTTFPKDTSGVWARVNPLWTAWPLRITKEEVEEMGIDISSGGQVSAEDVLARYDAVDVVSTHENGLSTMTSKQRLKQQPVLLGFSEDALKASLPHLDVGDAIAVCNEGADAVEANTPEGSKRKAMEDVLSGRHVLMSAENGSGGAEYGPWSTRYCGHQFGSWAGQLGDGRATSLFETQLPDGSRTEVQLKGAGRTPFSRTADGLAVLRSGVREFLGCEGESRASGWRHNTDVQPWLHWASRQHARSPCLRWMKRHCRLFVRTDRSRPRYSLVSRLHLSALDTSKH